MPEPLCACGQPLHYSSDVTKQYVEQTVVELGATVNVSIIGRPGKYAVQRHYLALHGLRADQLDALAAAGIVTALCPHGRNLAVVHCSDCDGDPR